MTSDTPIRLMVIGDGQVGKTSLLITYMCDEYPQVYSTTVLENDNGEVTINGQQVPFELWDTAGQQEYSHIRPDTRTQSNLDPHSVVTIICYSVVQRSTLTNVEEVWMKEIMEHPDLNGNTIILVGTKIDLRDETKQLGLSPVVSRGEGERLAKRIGAAAFFECSAKKRIGVKDVFDGAFRAILTERDKSDESCKCVMQ